MKKLILIALLALTACSKDNQEEQIDKGIHPIIGVWQATVGYCNDSGSEVIDYAEEGEVIIWEFTRDGIVRISWYGNSPVSFSYELVGNKIIAPYASTVDTGDVSWNISGGILKLTYFYEDGEWCTDEFKRR